MRILHTADLHLGRTFEGHSLDRDHAAILDQILHAIVARKPELLIIAGDIFDRAAPSEAAVRLFNGFIERVAHETDTAIAVIAGNHDSPDRIGAMSMLADRRRAIVRGALEADERPLLLDDEQGTVAVSALPFAYEFAARACFEDPTIASPEAVLRAQMASARRHVPDGARWIVIAHAFVAGAAGSDSERPLSRTAGGIETVAADVFDGAHYVALGHLHRPQAVGAPHIRYAGSPLAFGFDEAGAGKCMVLVELDGDGRIDVETLPFAPLRQVRTLRGTLAEILDAPASDDFVRPVLTDTVRQIDPMKRIRERLPNACGLVYERETAPTEARAARPSSAAMASPAQLVAEFLSYTRGTEPTPAENEIVAAELAALTTAGEHREAAE